MNSYVRWSDIRTAHVERAGGEQAVEDGKQALLATIVGHRLAEIRRTRGLTQQLLYRIKNGPAYRPGRAHALQTYGLARKCDAAQRQYARWQ